MNFSSCRNVICLFLTVFTVGLFLPSGLNAQNGVTLVGQLDQRHGGPGSFYPFYYAACWGYVAPDGHEYALMGCYSGTSIIDLDANPIQEVAFIPGVDSEWKEMKTWGQYGYSVADVSGSQGLQIINLSQLPDTAWLVRAVVSVGGRNISRNHTISVSDGYLYLNGGTGTPNGGSLILSLADPENPTLVGQYDPAYLHDCYVRNDTLYGAAIWGQGVYIASLANKTAPVTLGNVTYPNAGTHNTWVSRSGRYLFTTDEVGSTQKNMKVFDIQNLPSFTQLTPFTANPASIIHNIEGRGNYVYIAHYTAGVYVADIHNVDSIRNVGTYDTYTGTSTGYIGCWGVYPYFPSGRWIASDTQTGLYVFTFTGLAPRIRPSLLSPANGDSAGTGTAFRWQLAASQVEDPHWYQMHIWGSGVDTLLKTYDTTLALPSLSGLQNGQTYSWHVWTKDEYTAVTSQDTFQFVFKAGPVSVEPSEQQPQVFHLSQNYPNPFNPTTSINFYVPAVGLVTLKVFNVLGEEVATVVDGVSQAGEHAIRFDGSELPSGVYMYRLSSNGFNITRKMVLMK